MSLFSSIPTGEQALAFLAAHHGAALRSLAHEVMIADILRREAAGYNDVSFHHVDEASEAELAEGKVGIWTYASRIVLFVQGTIPDPVEVVLDYEQFVFVSYRHNISAHVVAAQLIAIYLDHPA